MSYDYGWYLGNRFKNYNNNIAWILGGERLPNEDEIEVEIWQAMAEGITDGVAGNKNFDKKSSYYKTFMTYQGYKPSSEIFKNDPWIDIHTWGTFQEKRNNERSYEVAGLENTKPIINSQLPYELFPVNYDWKKVGEKRFDNFDVRQAAYWSVFSGACGVNYGCNPVWQMYVHKNQILPLTSKNRIIWSNWH